MNIVGIFILSISMLVGTIALANYTKQNLTKKKLLSLVEYRVVKLSELEKLKFDVEQLRYEAESLEESLGYQIDRTSRVESRAESYRRNAEEAIRQAEYEAECRNDEIRRATKELERAREWHDDWGEERALRKLRNIY